MNRFVLHHYPQSPFAEKGRLLLGFKGLAWDSVTIPAVMPKPDLTALTGGYRRTPVLQCGADIYCDTALIARRLEREKSEPALFPAGLEAAAATMAQFADQVMFQHAVALNFQPASLAARLASVSPEQAQAFIADRKALFTGGNHSRPELPVALSQWPTLLGRLETQLAHGSAFLLGDQACIADIAYYHPLWFVANNANVSATFDPFPLLRAWMARVKAIGHGEPQRMESGVAVEIARDATPEVLAANDFVDPNGFTVGANVSISATDYGVDPVSGTLVWQDAEEIVLRREDPRAGVVHVHFPRMGFRLSVI
jgi:glutathione S-transferase